MSKVDIIFLVLAVAGVIGLGYFGKLFSSSYRCLKSLGKPRQLGAEARRLGIIEIWAKRGEASPIVSALFDKEKPSKVQMLGQSLAWLKDRGDEQVKLLLNFGCHFEFLLLDPASELMNMRIRQENPDLKNECEGFIEWVRSTFKGYAEQIEVKVHRMTPTMGITIINEQKLYVAPYAMTSRTHGMPLLMVERGGILFDTFMKQFTSVWHKADRVFPISNGGS